MKLILATRNPGKVEEINRLLSDLDIELLSSEEAGVVGEAIEDGKTLEENALKKATFVAQQTHEWTIADDSGVFIDALNGAPGVDTATWAGPHATTKEQLDFALEKMKHIPEEKRRASFKTVAVLMHPNGTYRTFEGRILAKISREPKGALMDGLPWSMICVPDGYTKTYSEMTIEEKNSVSHRGIAMRKVRDFLKNQVLTQNINGL